MKKKWSFNKFPKSLKKVLNHAGYCYDIKVKDFLKEVKKNDQTVLKIDYDFASNLDAYRDLFDEDLEKVVNEKTSEYPKFINWIGSHLFGDNMGTFDNVHENDNYDGKWEILIEISMENFKEAAAQGIDVLNFVKTAGGFNIEVYLIPIGFSLDHPLLGKSSKTITYGELSSKDFKKLGDDFKEALCSSIAVAGIENIIGKSESDVWLILGENEPEGYDYESERHWEVIERATHFLTYNLLESLNNDFQFFKEQIEGTLGCGAFWMNFCNLDQTKDIKKFSKGLQKVLEGKSSKIAFKDPITYGELSSKDFKKLGDDFKEALCSSIAVAGIENIIGKSESDVWLILGENEPEGYDYESEKHYEVIERATNLLSNTLLKSLNDDFKFFKKQIEGTLGCDSFWLNFCDFQQTNDINEFNEILQNILEEVT